MGFVVQRPFSHSHPAGSDRTGLYSVPRLSRVGSQVYRSAHLLEGGGPGSDADIGGRRGGTTAARCGVVKQVGESKSS